MILFVRPSQSVSELSPFFKILIYSYIFSFPVTEQGYGVYSSKSVIAQVE